MISLIKKVKSYLKSDRDLSSSRILSEGPIRIESGIKVSNEVQVGSYTFIGENVVLGPNIGKIGKFCSIGGGTIIGPNNHPINKLSSSAVFYSKSWGFSKHHLKDLYNSKKVKIKNDVWIGYNAIITGEVTVGNGAIIAAGSVVTKDVPDFAIVGGVPAKIIRFRFDESTRERILEMQWWDLPIEQAIEKYSQFESSFNL